MSENDMTERSHRVEQNEEAFRALNEGVREVEAKLRERDERRFICECARPDCTEVVAMPFEEYQEIRADPAAFFVKKGHEIGELERVVREESDYLVVKKYDGEGHAESD